MSTPRYSYVPIATQPAARTQLPTSPSLESITKESKNIVTSNSCGHTHEKYNDNYQHQEDFEAGHPEGHRHCHNGRLKQLILPLFLVSFGLIFIGALGCMMTGATGSGESSGWSVGEIFSRAVADSIGNGNNNGNGNTFMSRKLYLIVIFVGLLLVIILAVMLSAWCCRGAFKNPLCCPCYLCACCGGLACLECIGCGLCAEGVSEM